MARATKARFRWLLFVIFLQYLLTACVSTLPPASQLPDQGDHNQPPPGEDGTLRIAISWPSDNGWMSCRDSGCTLYLDPAVPNIWFGGSRDDYDSEAVFRWQNVKIPPGSTVEEAWIEMTHLPGESTVNQKPVKVVIRGFARENLPPFTKDLNLKDTTVWPRTGAAVEWSINEPWPWVEPTKVITPDIAPIIQEIIDLQGQNGWRSGNSLGIIFETPEDVPSDRYNRQICKAHEVINPNTDLCKDPDTAPVLYVKLARP